MYHAIVNITYKSRIELTWVDLNWISLFLSLTLTLSLPVSLCASPCKFNPTSISVQFPSKPQSPLPRLLLSFLLLVCSAVCLLLLNSHTQIFISPLILNFRRTSFSSLNLTGLTSKELSHVSHFLVFFFLSWFSFLFFARLCCQSVLPDDEGVEET